MIDISEYISKHQISIRSWHSICVNEHWLIILSSIRGNFDRKNESFFCIYMGYNYILYVPTVILFFCFSNKNILVSVGCVCVVKRSNFDFIIHSVLYYRNRRVVCVCCVFFTIWIWRVMKPKTSIRINKKLRRKKKVNKLS
jgi:hypothetical protein